MNKLHNFAGCNLYVSIWTTVLQDLYKILLMITKGEMKNCTGFLGADAISTLPTATLFYVTLFFCDTTLMILDWGRIE